MEKVTKIFKKRKALDDITVNFPGAEISVVLGLSGSGKTVLLRCLSGELKPDSGRIIRKNSGLCAYACENPDYFSKFVASDILAMWRLLYPDFEEEKFRSFIGEKNISKNRQLFNLALVSASNADVVIFDEPSECLDSEEKPEFLDLLKELARKGKTVIIGATEIGEFESITDRVVVLSSGRVVVAAKAAELLSSHRLFPGATTISPDYKVIGPVFNERLIQTDEDIGRKAALKEIVTGYVNGSSS